VLLLSLRSSLVHRIPTEPLIDLLIHAVVVSFDLRSPFRDTIQFNRLSFLQDHGILFLIFDRVTRMAEKASGADGTAKGNQNGNGYE
jgi:hypothetical protein